MTLSIEEKDINEVKKVIIDLGRSLDEVRRETSALSEKIDKLAKSVAELSREVGKLSDTYGFIVEDIARSFLPSWFYLNMDLTVNEFNRVFLNIGDKVLELDLYGEGCDKTGNQVILIGEAKARIHGEDVRVFHEKVNKFINKENSRHVIFMFGLYIHPTAMQEALNRGVILISPYATITRTPTNKIIQNTS
jgi:hypothetical protein